MPVSFDDDDFPFGLVTPNLAILVANVPMNCAISNSPATLHQDFVLR